MLDRVNKIKLNRISVHQTSLMSDNLTYLIITSESTLTADSAVPSGSWVKVYMWASMNGRGLKFAHLNGIKIVFHGMCYTCTWSLQAKISAVKTVCFKKSKWTFEVE